jgi:mannose-1-phosphate guanylyltransferase
MIESAASTARARPFTTHLWGIALSGSTRGGRLPRRRLREPHGAGRHAPAPLRHTLECASRVIPERQLIAVIARDHSAYYDAELRGLGEVERVVQPRYRGSAAEIFLPVLKVHRRDPHATVVVLPADGFVGYEPRLMTYVAKAIQAVTRRPDLPVVIGTQPAAPDPEWPWIEPGEPVEGLEDFGVHAVRRFYPAPSRAQALTLYDGDGLLSTGVIVARARTLLDLGTRYLPDVLETLEPLEAHFGAPEEPLLCEAVYEGMPVANISCGLFTAAEAFAVLPVADVVCRDLSPALAAAAC